MKKKTVLCIIDMQHHNIWCLKRTWSEVVNIIVAEIHKAKQKKHVIVVVEYVWFPTQPTDKKIIKAIGDYPAIIVQKNSPDGSKEITKALSNAGIQPRKIFVCGQATACCVLETVIGLRKKLSIGQVVVIPTACFDELWSEQYVPKELRQKEKQKC